MTGVDFGDGPRAASGGRGERRRHSGARRRCPGRDGKRRQTRDFGQSPAFDLPNFRRVSLTNHSQRLTLATSFDHDGFAVRDPLYEQRDRLGLVFAVFDHLLSRSGVGHRKSVDAQNSIADVKRVMQIGMIALLPSRDPNLQP